MSFGEFDFTLEIKAGIHASSYINPTPIQFTLPRLPPESYEMRKKAGSASQTIRVQQKRVTVVNAEGRTLPIKSRHRRRRTK